MDRQHKLILDNRYHLAYNQIHMKLHDSQKKLLKFLKDIDDLDGLSYWEIARETGLTNAQNVVHHLGQLEKLGYLRRDLTNLSKFEILKDPIEDVIYLNMLGFAQCGHRNEFFSEGNIKDKIAVSTKLFGISNPEKCFIVRAKGDSMEPEISENDLIIFESRESVDDSNVALVCDNGEVKIKQLFYLKDGILLKSWNKKHEDRKISKKDDFHVLGLARHIMRSL